MKEIYRQLNINDRSNITNNEKQNLELLRKAFKINESNDITVIEY